MLAALAATPVAGPPRRGAGRDARARQLRAAQLHDACGRAAAAAGVNELVVIGGEAADGLAEGALPAACPRARPPVCRQRQRGRPRSGARRAPATSCSSRVRAARAPTSSSTACWGWRDAVPPPAATRAARPARHGARAGDHVPHGGREPERARAQPAPRTLVHRPAAAIPDRPGRAPGRSVEPQGQGRHADDGRPADSDGGVRADAALGEPDQPVRLDRDSVHGRVRRDWLRGRLPEDHAAQPPRPVRALQAAVAGDRVDRRRAGAASGSPARRRQPTTCGSSFRSSRTGFPISAGSTSCSPSSCSST